MYRKLNIVIFVCIALLPELGLGQMADSKAFIKAIAVDFFFEKVSVIPKESYLRKCGNTHALRCEFSFKFKQEILIGAEILETKFREHLIEENPPLNVFTDYFHTRLQIRFPIMVGLPLIHNHKLKLTSKLGLVTGFVKYTETRAVTKSGFESKIRVDGLGLGKSLAFRNEINIEVLSVLKRVNMHVYSFINSTLVGYKYQNVNNRIGMDGRYSLGFGLGVQYVICQ